MSIFQFTRSANVLLLFALYTLSDVCAARSSSLPKSADEIAPSARQAIMAAYPQVSDWAWASPRIGSTSWSKGRLTPSSRMQFHAVQVNFLDPQNLNRDGLVLLQQATPARGRYEEPEYKLVAASGLWLSGVNRNDGWERLESIRIENFYVWFQSYALSRDCDYSDRMRVGASCQHSIDAYQFRFVNNSLKLIGYKRELFNASSSDIENRKSIYRCSVNFLTLQQQIWDASDEKPNGLPCERLSQSCLKIFCHLTLVKVQVTR
jgi:hypothetical protein